MTIVGVPIEIELAAALLTIKDDSLYVLLANHTSVDHTSMDHTNRRSDAIDCLPHGNFDPSLNRSLDYTLKRWVRELTGLDLSYVEQLYSFGDRGRHSQTFGSISQQPALSDAHVVSIGYLGLVKPDELARTSDNSRWCKLYDYFPLEDWRDMVPENFGAAANYFLNFKDAASQDDLASRLARSYGLRDFHWEEELCLDRYELLYQLGLVDESVRDGVVSSLQAAFAPIGKELRYDHRRILATALSRLRSKLRYRPVVFDLMPNRFTLTSLQRAVEAVVGTRLHKQNFRRMVKKSEQIVACDANSISTGGRPAKLFSYSRDATFAWTGTR